MINFLMAIHNHQPVGNFDYVMEDSYRKGYAPFLSVLERHPKIKLSLHTSGILLEWLRQNHPDYIERVRKLVKQGQVEILTGGFYEPILPIIPDRDKAGQIAKENAWVKDHFGCTTSGMWVAERVWEPHLPRVIAPCGVQYAILDGTHFKMSGLLRDQLFGYYMTEEQGHTLGLFPINDDLRDMIPFQSVDRVMEWLYRNANDGRGVFFADDGEKFGVWPGTFHSVYEEQWLEHLFSRIEADPNIRMWTYGEYRNSMRPLGQIYLPATSYPEMLAWSQPPDTIERFEDFRDKLKAQGLTENEMQFVRSGGFWRNFLVKYPESNQMHKRMLWLSARLEKLQGEFGDDQRFKEAQDLVWQSQCNCPYWHGVFGGLYLNHLRFAIYRKLIQADKLLDQLEFSGSWQTAQAVDFDCDGQDEVIVGNRNGFYCFRPAQGGQLVEMDLKDFDFNVADGMSRRKESYHRKIVSTASAPAMGPQGAKESGLHELLDYDWYRRGSFIDHVLGADATLDSFRKCCYPEQGDFVLEPYEFETKKVRSDMLLSMRRNGHVWKGDRRLGLQIEKVLRFSAAKNRIEAVYTLKNTDQEAMDLRFGVEFLFTLLAGNAEDRFYSSPKIDIAPRHMASIGSLDNVSCLELNDGWLRLKLALSSEQPATWWRFPIETVSQSESGYERVYQASVLLPHWPVSLGGGESWSNTLLLEFLTM